MNKMLRNIAVVAVVLVAFTGCFKKVTVATTLRIKPLAERESGKGLFTAEGCYAYLYYNATETDTIMSYADAAAYTITNKLTGEKRSVPDAIGTLGEVWQPSASFLGIKSDSLYAPQGSKVEYITLNQEKASAFVVVVYPAAKMYAYMHRKSEAENLPYTYLTVIFHSWKTGKPYNEGSKEGYKWIVFPSEESVAPEPEQPEQPTEPEMPEDGEGETSTND